MITCLHAVILIYYTLMHVGLLVHSVTVSHTYHSQLHNIIVSL